MKREEKSARSRQRIIEAAMREFSAKGYGGASLNTICAEHDISKGIIYHYFQDKDALYLTCVGECFTAFTTYMKGKMECFEGTMKQKVQAYFDARLRFLAKNPLYLGIFADAVFDPPPSLVGKITESRREFDELSIWVLTEFLNGEVMRDGLVIPAVVEDFRMYMDFFNIRFKEVFKEKVPSEIVLKEHEERSHRQLDILLYGVLCEKNEK